MKYGFFSLNACQRSVLSGIRFISTGQFARFRRPRPTTSPERMRHARQLFQVHRRINLHIAERIEIFDRHVQFFGKKLRRVRHDGRAAGQKQPLRRRTALLAAIKLHRLVDLDVQLGHELPRDFGNGRLVRIFRLFIRAAQADEALGDFDLLGDSSNFNFASLAKSCVMAFAPRLMLREKTLPFSKNSRLLVLAPMSSSMVQSSRSP